jgi:hypothetical protein
LCEESNINCYNLITIGVCSIDKRAIYDQFRRADNVNTFDLLVTLSNWKYSIGQGLARGKIAHPPFFSAPYSFVSLLVPGEREREEQAAVGPASMKLFMSQANIHNTIPPNIQ